MNTSTDIAQKMQNIKLFILDVDGVLTDGKLYISHDGTESKAFNTQDGLGIKRLQRHTDIEIAVISGRKSRGTELRLQELQIKHIFLGYSNKIPVYEELLSTLNISPDQVAYMGDDLPDAEVMQHVGLSIAVNNAVTEVKKIADLVTEKNGGEGAVRMACEHLINAVSMRKDSQEAFPL